MLMCAGVYVPWHSYGGQSITCGSHFSSSTTWVQGLNSGHLAQWQYLHLLGPLARPQNGIFKRMKNSSEASNISTLKHKESKGITPSDPTVRTE